MKILIATLSSPGFIFPAVPVARALRRLGHSVTVLAERPAARLLDGEPDRPGDILTPAALGCAAGSLHVARWHQEANIVPQEAVVRAAALESGADVVVTSELCLGAVFAAERLGLPVAVLGLMCQLWYSPEHPAVRGDAELVWRYSTMRHIYADLRGTLGLGPAPADEMPMLGDLQLVRGHPALEPDIEQPSRTRFVGGCRWEPHPLGSDLLPRADDRPLVYVHLGREFGGTALLPRLRPLLFDDRYRVVVDVGRSGTPVGTPVPDAVWLVQRPYMEPFLRHAVAVISNGTSAPVLGALAHGLPVVLAPNGSEQPVVARAGYRAGIGVALDDTDPVGTVDRVVADVAMAGRAAALGAAVCREDGPDRAAAAIAGLHASNPAPTVPLNR